MLRVASVALFICFLLPGIAMDSLQVFTYEEVIESYIGGKFKATLIREDVDDTEKHSLKIKIQIIFLLLLKHIHIHKTFEGKLKITVSY